MKKKILIIATVAILLSLMAYGTLAYFNASTTAVNRVTMGNIDAKVVETTKENENSEEQPYPSAPVSVMPGTTISKIARVKNTGSSSAWIRAKVVIDAGEVELPVGTTLESLVTLGGTNTAWTKEADGWYYYNAEVAANASTEPLFETVKFDGEGMGNEFAEKQIIINVVAEAVQSANNGTSVSDAKGWPNS